MTDDDLDQRLRDHGTAWRDANNDRPGVNWDLVTATHGSKRGWFAAAGVAVAAAVIIVPIAISAGGRSTSGPPPAKRPSPSPSPSTRPVRAPVEMFGIVASGVKEVGGGRAWISGKTKTPVIAIGASPKDRDVYSASAVSACRITIQDTFFPPPSTHGNGVRDSGISQTVAAVNFGEDVQSINPPPMAVSPDGTRLAFETNRARDPKTGKCVLSERLTVLDLRTHQVRTWAAPRAEVVRSLAWSPNGRDLAYLTADACAFQPFSASICYSASAGTRVLDTSALGNTLGASPLLLPAFGGHGGYGPVFWWRGSLATTFNGSLRQLNGHGALGKVLATGFPQVVDSVSSDPSGDHLLISSEVKTYRWDNGRLAVVKGTWVQPGW
jgi:hypothetical protein